MSSTRSTFLAAALALLAACGDAGAGGAADAAVDSDVPDGWSLLLAGDWMLNPGGERYYCVYVTVPRDLYVKAFRPINPEGTHHTVLTRYDGPVPDGTYTCTALTNGQDMIYGSGVGSPDFVFPTGVGMHLTAGTRLLLNLHLYNVSDQPLRGRSGTLFQEAAAAEIEHLGELVLAGPTSGLTVPPGTSTQSGSCGLSRFASEPIQVFAVASHMHKLGRHMRSVVRRGGQDLVLQDTPYEFEHQDFRRLTPAVELRPTDVLTTYCSYDNQTGDTVTFGDSSDDEMCFTELFYYPAQRANFLCTDL